MRLILVRHGATANNAEQRFTGQTDVPLSPLGLRQAQALAYVLAADRFDLMLSSDLSRARQTCDEIARHQPGPMRLDADLREFAMGAWEGRTFAEITDTHPTAFARWQTSADADPPPGGESVQEVGARIARAVDRCIAEFPAGDVLWVTHGGVIGVLLCHLLTLDPAQRWRFRRDNAAITELDVGPDRAVLVRLNDTCHLRDLPSAEAIQVL